MAPSPVEFLELYLSLLSRTEVNFIGFSKSRIFTFECGKSIFLLYSILQLPGIDKLQIVQLLSRSTAPCRDLSIHGFVRPGSTQAKTISVYNNNILMTLIFLYFLIANL